MRAESVSYDDPARQLRLGWLLIFMSAIAWSTAGFFIRLIPLDAWTTLFWRGIFGGLFLGGYVIWLYRWDTFRVMRSLRGPGWMMITVGVVAQITFICAVKLTTVANVMIIYATVPFFAAVLAWLWLREKVSVGTLLASAVAFAGVAIMLEGSGFNGGHLGDILALAMTFAFAVVMVMVRRYRSLALVPAVCLTNLMTALVTLPLATMLEMKSEHLVYLALFGFFQITLGFTLFTLGSRLIPAVQTALIGALETPLGPLWVWLVFGETPSNSTLIGGAVVMTAVVVYMGTESHSSRRARVRPVTPV